MAMLHFWKTETTQNQVESAFDARMSHYLFRDEINSLPFNYKPMVAQPIYRMAGVFVNYSKLLRPGDLWFGKRGCVLSRKSRLGKW